MAFATNMTVNNCFSVSGGEIDIQSISGAIITNNHLNIGNAIAVKLKGCKDAIVSNNVVKTGGL